MDLLDLRRRIESRSVPEPNTGCWLWLGAYDPNGYGAIKVDGKKIGTHIAAYRAFKPDGETINLSRGGFWIDHICMTSACVCPDHLRAVTPRVSVLENSNSIVSTRSTRKGFAIADRVDSRKPLSSTGRTRGFGPRG